MSNENMRATMLHLREAVQVSWGQDTAYQQAFEEGNPALGNCYPTSRVVQHFFPKMEIVHGTVWTGERDESHFWNVLIDEGVEYHFDLTWQQFPHGSVVKEYTIRDRETLNDSDATIIRVKTLLGRVSQYLRVNQEL